MKKVLTGLAVLTVILIGTFAYYGGFNKINIRMEEQGGEILVYENMKGDYNQTGKVLGKVYTSLLNEEKVKTTKGFGFYLDNPETVQKEKLRSEIGCILEEADMDKLPQLEKKYEIRVFPKKSYLVTEFPYKNMGSIYMNVFKVYPAYFGYIEKQGYKPKGGLMEIYDMPNKMTIFRMEVKK